MKAKKIVKIVDDNRPKIKVRLDYRTIIIIRSMEAFKMWLTKFPDAKIITS